MRDWLRRIFGHKSANRQARALAKLTASAEKFRQAAEHVKNPEAEQCWRLAGATSALQARLSEDANQITPLRKLVFFFIPRMADLALTWAERRADDPFADHEPQTVAAFNQYAEVIEAAERACATRDLQHFNSRWAAFESQFERHRP